MATQAEYNIGIRALAKIIKGDIDADVPEFFRGMIPAEMVPQISTAGAKAVIDAVDAWRAKHPPLPSPQPKEQLK